MAAGVPQSASNAVRFLLDGEPVSASELPATTTVLDYLRETLRRTGTKEGCAEGDCGACTVVLGELSPDGARVGYRAINSCIRLLPTIDGQELVTVESLQARDGALHPVQQAMVDNHGSQCGFCTPGFVMSLFALYLHNQSPAREEVLDALSGNLCRCTGYRPIIDAGLRMGSYPTPAHWSREAACSTVRLAALRALRRTQSLKFPGFQAPRSCDELAAAFEADPTAVLLAGGTDIGLWVTQQLRELPSILYIGEVAELKCIRSDAAGIVIGAAVPLTEGWGAIVAAYPQLAEMAQRFGSPPVRNSGTLCGNIANGSPIGMPCRCCSRWAPRSNCVAVVTPAACRWTSSISATSARILPAPSSSPRWSCRRRWPAGAWQVTSSRNALIRTSLRCVPRSPWISRAIASAPPDCVRWAGGNSGAGAGD